MDMSDGIASNGGEFAVQSVSPQSPLPSVAWFQNMVCKADGDTDGGVYHALQVVEHMIGQTTQANRETNRVVKELEDKVRNLEMQYKKFGKESEALKTELEKQRKESEAGRKEREVLKTELKKLRKEGEGDKKELEKFRREREELRQSQEKLETKNPELRRDLMVLGERTAMLPKLIDDVRALKMGFKWSMVSNFFLSEAVWQLNSATVRT